MSALEKPNNVNPEDMKRESIEAVRRGDALPTPEFAAEEGGEMFAALASEIEKLDGKQLDALYQALDSERDTSLDALQEKLTSKASLIERNAHIMPIFIAFVLGDAAAYAVGGGLGAALASGMAAVGGTAVLAHVPFSKWPQEKKDAALLRLERVRTLVEKTQARRSQQTEGSA